MDVKDYEIVDSVEKLEEAIARVRKAQKLFATYTQEQVDKIFLAAASAANKARIPLAKMAVEETGMGVVEDKVIKNNYASEYIYNAYKNTKTCGVIEEDKAYGMKKIAEPIGIIAAVIPTTNPTSTAIFKCLIALKTRNAIIISPHPRAKNSTIAAAKLVLEAANKVISNNRSRKDKKLRTDGEKGSQIILMNADTQLVEAMFTADTIIKLVKSGKCQYSDIAVLYRMNALSRTLESSLREHGIPFKIYGGMRFYDRKEIKDVFAYLRVIADGQDNLAFERIINVPKRGIGDATVDVVRELAMNMGTDCLTICRDAYDFPELQRAAGKLNNFYALIDMMRQELYKNEKSFSEYIDFVENKSGIVDDIIAQRESKGELIDRVENLKELLTEAVEFEKTRRSESFDETELKKTEADNDILNIEIQNDPYLEGETKNIDTLEGLLNAYLETAALYASGDDDEESDNNVKLMSIHSAKGLEFNAVFIVGAEEGVFPSYKCLSTESDLEEERRLMYVAITRAKRNLFITLTRNRMLFGQTQCNAPSRFLKEIPPELLYKMGTKREAVKPVEAPRPKIRVDSAKQISSMMANGFGRKKETPDGLAPSEMVVGLKVVHNRFGEGIIIKAEQVAGDCLVTIDFDGMKKNMLAKSAGLKKAE